jgi:hypothetical protein
MQLLEAGGLDCRLLFDPEQSLSELCLSFCACMQLLEAGGLERLLSDPKALKEAVVFAAATGALTCTKPGAIAAQPSLEQVQGLFEESKGWYNFW